MTNSIKQPCSVVAGSEDWMNLALNALDELGYVILQNVFESDFCVEVAERMRQARRIQFNDLRKEGLIGDEDPPFVLGLMKYDNVFIETIMQKDLVALAQNYLGAEAILRNQMAQFVSPIEEEHDERMVFHNFHRQFRYIRNTCRITLEAGILLGDLNSNNGALTVIPGSHRYKITPTETELKKHEVLLTARAGSVFLLDGMTWHRELDNLTTSEFPLLIQQYSNQALKQYMDFPRYLGKEFIESLPAETRQVLGAKSQAPASLNEYFNPPERDLYTKNSADWIVKVQQED